MLVQHYTTPLKKGKLTLEGLGCAHMGYTMIYLNPQQAFTLYFI
jgi:hypothetical protein